MKEFPLLNVLNIHENLLEALLSLQAYPDTQALLGKYDGEWRRSFISFFLINRHNLIFFWLIVTYVPLMS